ncbi:hypothetical protein [Paraburkholderia caffeinilytica]|uniref:hypothetical protein n=1 Tax=Paraburkholderia caffeinilytica TaxID=1761016 RepID=UPI003DA04250
MDESVQQHLTAPAVCQTVSPALQSVAPATTRATPRKIPGLSESPRRGFVVTDRKLVGGNLCARDMLGHLRYWLEPDESGKPRSNGFHEGHYWEYCSITFWERQLGYSRGEVRNGIRALLASGAVVRESRRQGNNNYDHYRLVLDVAGVKIRDCASPSTGVSTYACASTPPACASTPMTEVTAEVSKEKIKIHKQEFPSGDSGKAIPGALQEQPGENENQPASPEAVKEPPKKKKPGPKPAPENIGSGDWDSYFRLSKKYDMDALHKLCASVSTGFVKGTTMLAEIDCERLERLEYFLECIDGETLEEHLTWLRGGQEAGEAYQYQHWMTVCDCMVGGGGKDLSCPPRPRLDFYDKHLPKFKAFLKGVFDATVYGPPKPDAATALESSPALPTPGAGLCASTEPLVAPAKTPIAEAPTVTYQEYLFALRDGNMKVERAYLGHLKVAA